MTAWNLSGQHMIIRDTPEDRERAENLLGPYGKFEYEISREQVQAILDGEVLACQAGEHEYTVFVKVKRDLAPTRKIEDVS